MSKPGWFGKARRPAETACPGEGRGRAAFISYCGEFQVSECTSVDVNKLKSMAANIDQFGSLLAPVSFDTSEYKVRPLDDFSERVGFLNGEVNRDGYLYPPIQETWEIDPLTGDKVKLVPKSRRPADLHRPIPTHTIEFVGAETLPSDFRKREGDVILRILEVIYETQLQFHDWWWVDRVRLNRSVHEWLRREDLEVAINKAIQKWRALDDKEKRVFRNACFFFSRSATYLWSYEKFTSLYTCLDAVWWLTKKHFRLPDASHSQRFNQIIKAFGLPENSALVGEIVERRRTLFHEAVWSTDGDPMREDSVGIHYADTLRGLAQRSLLAFVGLENTYVRSRWDIRGGAVMWDNPK